MMPQQTLALTLRGLRVDQRLLRTHLVRLGYLGIIYLYVINAHSTRFRVGAAGLELFTYLSYINAVLLTLAGVSYFATCITEEKEEMTLGLLKMAGINPLSLILGKSMPRLLGTIILLSIQFPFTLLAITLGGVTIHQVWAAYCALLVYLLFVAQVGLFCSVISRTSRGAVFLTGVIVFGFIIGPFIGYFFVEVLDALHWMPRTSTAGMWCQEALQWCVNTSVWARLSVIMTTGFDQAAINSQIITIFCFAAAFFIAGWLLFNRCTQNETPVGPARVIRAPIRRRGRAPGTRNIWGNALAWKDFHFVVGGNVMLIGKFGLYFALLQWIPLAGIASRHSNWNREAIGGSIMVTMLIALLLELAFMVGRVMRTETRWNTLQLLTMLPISTAKMFWSKFFGCLMGLIPAATFFLLGAMIYPEGIAEFLDDALDEVGFYYAVSQYLLFLHLVVLLSISIKWGAMPLAFAIMFIGNQMVFMMMFGVGGGGEEAVLGVFVIFSCIGMGVIQLLVASRLRTLAGA